jgi:signal transduction histidine kinase
MAEFRALRATVMRLWRQHIGVFKDSDLDDIIRFDEAIDQLLTSAINKHVEVASEYRDRFTRMLGHDLRTPLTVITFSVASLLKSRDLAPQCIKSVSRIMANTERLQNMATALLEFTRMRFGAGIPIAPSAVELGAVCRQALEEAEACHPGLRITFEQGGELLGFWDRDRIVQIVSNLIANAIKHGDADTSIHVTARPAAESIELSVHNDGPPVPDSVARLIFEPFICDGKRDIRKFQGGIGLGLCIVKEIVEAHGGKVTMKSSREAGTTFTVCLPHRVPGSSLVAREVSDGASAH